MDTLIETDLYSRSRNKINSACRSEFLRILITQPEKLVKTAVKENDPQCPTARVVLAADCSPDVIQFHYMASTLFNFLYGTQTRSNTFPYCLHSFLKHNIIQPLFSEYYHLTSRLYTSARLLVPRDTCFHCQLNANHIVTRVAINIEDPPAVNTSIIRSEKLNLITPLFQVPLHTTPKSLPSRISQSGSGNCVFDEETKASVLNKR